MARHTDRGAVISNWTYLLLKNEDSGLQDVQIRLLNTVEPSAFA